MTDEKKAAPPTGTARPEHIDSIPSEAVLTQAFIALAQAAAASAARRGRIHEATAWLQVEARAFEFAEAGQ